MSIPNLSGTDIISYLNSGKFISSTTRKKLEEKLEEEKKCGLVNGLDEFLSLIAPSPKAKPKKQTMDFPELSNSASIETSNNTLNFVKLLEKINILENEEEEQKIKNSENLSLSYNDIKNVYDKFAIHRIRMEYLIFQRKLYLLDKLKLKERWNECLQRKNVLERCIGIYIFIHKILSKKNFKNISELRNMLVGFFDKYLKDISEENIDKKILIDLLNNIIRDTDSHLECEYHVLVKTSSNEIIPNKLVNVFTISFNNEINLYYDNNLINNKRTDEKIINSNRSFYDSKLSQNNRFVKILGNDFKMLLILQLDNELPFNVSFIKINDLPKKYRYIYSFIKNASQNNTSINLIYQRNITTNLWLEKNNNRFIVEYLFNKLLEMYHSDGIILPEMKTSFLAFARDTST